MNSIECVREQDVLDAVASGRWPDRDPDLRAHVDRCSICADVAEIAEALHVEAHVAWEESTALPPGSVVWWRAQIRARTEARRLASRPIAVVQALGLASIAGIVVGLACNAEWGIPLWSRWFTSGVAMLATAGGTDVVGLALRGALLAVGVWLVLAPVAVYLATDD